MTRPAAVDALFAGHTLPKSKAALDEVREYIRGLEMIKEAALKAAKEKPVGTVARSTGGQVMPLRIILGLVLARILFGPEVGS